MKKSFLALAVLVLVGGLVIYFNFSSKKSPNNFPNQSPIINLTPMKIQSPSFDNNESIPSKYTCDGENINPPLEFLDIPDQAKSLALIVDDPDAPAGTWVHWVLWNLEPNTPEILENNLPPVAKQGLTSFGSPGYGGPCPPSGEHRYFFKVYALDTTLNLRSDTTADGLTKAMTGHILSQAELIGKYARKR